jgi:hypothetical protein
MESKKINQLATELTPDLSDLTIIGDPNTGISKKITLSQMASLFTGTVEEYANFAAFPLVGVADTIYVAKDTNVIYRWDSTAYVVLSPNIIASLVFNDANGFDGNIALVGSVATLTITTALTTGSVGFIGASGALLQNNANFFWDDTNNRLGLGTNAPTTALDVFGSGIIGRINATSTNNAYLGFSSAGTNKWSVGNVQSDHRFRIFSEANSAELISVLQTGEFGIGIANPLTKFHIDGGASALIANLDANVSVAKTLSFRSDNSNRINLEVSGTESGSNAGANFFIRRYSDAGSLIDTPLTITRSTGFATFSSNIGLGVAPTTNWRSTDKVLQLQKNGILHSQTDANIVSLGVNYYINSINQFVYSESDFISRYAQYQGQHEFYSAPSGTAGNTVTLTRLMTITQSGIVGIGTPTPKTYSTLTNTGQLINLNNIGIDVGQSYRFNNYYNSGTGTDRTISTGYAGQIGYENSTGSMLFYTSASSISADNNITVSEKMRITSTGFIFFGTVPSATNYVKYNFNVGTDLNIGFRSASGIARLEATNDAVNANIPMEFTASRFNFTSGNVGINTASPTATLDVNGEIRMTGSTLFRGMSSNTLQLCGGTSSSNIKINGASEIITLDTNGSTRMTITTNGQTNLNHSTTNLDIIAATNSSASPYGMNITFNGAAPNNTTNNFIYLADTSGLKCRIVSNGSIYNSTGTYGPISDIKLKENITNTTSKLDKLMQVRIVNYNLIGDELNQIGVIAQELEKVFPALVDESEDFEEIEISDKEGNIIKEKKSLGTTTKSVKMSVFIPMLIKAMQEQQAQIEELKEKLL